ncbi:MAG TPA: phage integrase N-terminal SAM-like domain-containing protein [Gammaproteobacteria bacterium]|nr:phage integrase N-terminal SAM-like domain-containing protein [Gammaproteobacteria bacterium]
MDVAPRPRLFDAVRTVLRRHHYSFRTEKTYLFWIRDFIRFNDRIHSRELGPEADERYLGWLATERRVSASTRNQALSALPFLYQRVLDMALPRLEGYVRAKASRRLPTVLTC